MKYNCSSYVHVLLVFKNFLLKSGAYTYFVRYHLIELVCDNI